MAQTAFFLDLTDLSLRMKYTLVNWLIMNKFNVPNTDIPQVMNQYGEVVNIDINALVFAMVDEALHSDNPLMNNTLHEAVNKQFDWMRFRAPNPDYQILLEKGIVDIPPSIPMHITNTETLDTLESDVLDQFYCEVVNIVSASIRKIGCYGFYHIQFNGNFFSIEYFGDMRIRDFNLRNNLAEWQGANLMEQC